jgi:hypothetical protein
MMLARGSPVIQLLTVSFDRCLYKLDIDRKSRRLLAKQVLLSNFGGSPLDVWVQAEKSVFPGSIWIADHGSSSIYVLDPTPSSWDWSRIRTASWTYARQAGKRLIDFFSPFV